MNQIAQVIDRIRSGLNPGQPHGSHGLTLVPLFGGAPAKEYLTAEEAFEAGVLTIAEVDGGNVPEVAAVNSAEVPILLLDGEHIEGAMHNRVLNSTVLIAAKQKTILRSLASSTVAGIRKRASTSRRRKTSPTPGSVRRMRFPLREAHAERARGASTKRRCGKTLR